MSDEPSAFQPTRIFDDWGVNSETAPLRRVALARPPDTLADISDPRANLLRAKPDLERLRRQASALADYYRLQGITVSLLDAPQAPPNIIFLRDTFLMSPLGAVLARPLYLQRRAEIPYVRDFLIQEGIPIVGEVRNGGTFEGADALWLRPNLLLLGVGNRTNAEGARQVSGLMAEIGVETLQLSAPPQSQHLLGAINFNRSAAAIVRPCFEKSSCQQLRRAGTELFRVEDDEDVVERRCLNFVAIGSGRLVAPQMSATAQSYLARTGCQVDMLDVDEFLNCDGGIACATGILGRAINSEPDPPKGARPTRAGEFK